MTTDPETAAAREIILDCLVGALCAHEPNWTAVHDDPIINHISAAIREVARAYPAPADPIAVEVFAEMFGRNSQEG